MLLVIVLDHIPNDQSMPSKHSIPLSVYPPYPYPIGSGSPSPLYSFLSRHRLRRRRKIDRHSRHDHRFFCPEVPGLLGGWPRQRLTQAQTAHQLRSLHSPDIDSLLRRRPTELPDCRDDRRTTEKTDPSRKSIEQRVGTPLLIPNKRTRVGDVAYFLGAQVVQLFNVFDLTEAVTAIPFCRPIPTNL
jgi:hypothetical protein